MTGDTAAAAEQFFLLMQIHADDSVSPDACHDFLFQNYLHILCWGHVGLKADHSQGSCVSVKS